MALLISGPQAAAIVSVAFIVINGGIQNIVLPRRMGEDTDSSAALNHSEDSSEREASST